MAAPVDPFPDFVPGQPARANEVDARFHPLYAALDPAQGGTDLVALAAAVAAAAFLPGDVKPTVRTSAPAGWLVCDGAPVSRSGATAALFSAIGTTYGVGDGSTTFNLPNLKGKVPAGMDAAQTEFQALGTVGGAKTVALTDPAQMPAHGHSNTLAVAAAGNHSHLSSAGGTILVRDDNGIGGAGLTLAGTPDFIAFFGQTNNSGDHTHALSGGVSSAGSGSPHANLQPYLTVLYLIKT